VLTPIYNYIPESDISMIMERVSNLDTLEEACGKLIVNLIRELCRKDSDAMNNAAMYSTISNWKRFCASSQWKGKTHSGR